MANPYGNLAIPGPEGCLYDTLLLLTGSGPGVSYQWYMDGSPIPNANDDSLWVYLGGYYQVYLTDSVCTYTSDSMEVVIHHLPQVGTPPFDTVYECAGSLDLMVNTVPPGGTWSGQGVVGDSFYVAQSGLGSWNLLYSVTDSNGCTNVDDKVVTVVPDLVPQFDIPIDSFCMNWPAVALSPYATPSGGVFSGQGVSGQAFNPASTFIGTHILQYEVPHPSPNCNFVAYDTVTVLAIPPPPTIFLLGDTLYSNSSNTDWYISLPTTNYYVGSGPSYVPTISSAYFATVVDSNGCESDPSTYINVIVGLDAAFDQQISLYPNPNSGAFSITQLPAGIYQAHIYDVQMRELRNWEMECRNGEDAVVQVNELPRGVYGLELLDAYGSRRWARFVKK